MRRIVLVLGLMGMAACSSESGNAAGDYMVSITNRGNDCGIASWTAGTVNTATVTLTQSDSSVTASVTGLGAIALELIVGEHVYTGRISGDTLALNLFGTRTSTIGNCTYTLNSEIHAALDGDAMTGQIDYRSATNDNPDCAAIKDCRSFQDFTGTRPPS